MVRSCDCFSSSGSRWSTSLNSVRHHVHAHAPGRHCMSHLLAWTGAFDGSVKLFLELALPRRIVSSATISSTGRTNWLGINGRPAGFRPRFRLVLDARAALVDHAAAADAGLISPSPIPNGGTCEPGERSRRRRNGTHGSLRANLEPPTPRFVPIVALRMASARAVILGIGRQPRRSLTHLEPVRRAVASPRLPPRTAVLAVRPAHFCISRRCGPAR